MDTVERALRGAHGPAVATLARVLGDLTLAEDAVQDAVVAALRRWPVHGIPDNPTGWLVTTARNRAVDELRRAARGRRLCDRGAPGRGARRASGGDGDTR